MRSLHTHQIGNDVMVASAILLQGHNLRERKIEREREKVRGRERRKKNQWQLAIHVKSQEVECIHLGADPPVALHDCIKHKALHCKGDS